MNTNSMQGTQNTNTQAGTGANAPAGEGGNTQAGAGVDSSAAGAGGVQPGVVGGVPRFNPAAGVDSLGGGGNGARPVDSGGAQGQPKGTADAGTGGTGQPDVKALQQQLQDATTKAAQLQADLDKAIGKRQDAKTSNEELVQSVTKLEGALRQRDTVDSVLAGIPASKAKLARAVVLGLPNGALPIDLASVDQAATVKAVTERLKADHPDLFVEAAPPPAIPKVTGSAVGPGGVTVQRVGIHNPQGERIL